MVVHLLFYVLSYLCTKAIILSLLSCEVYSKFAEECDAVA